MKVQMAQLPFWLHHIPGAAVGLFLARLALEVAWRPWPGAFVVAVSLLAAAGGGALGRRLASRSRASVVGHWSSVVLLLYVLWPRRDPVVAASVALLAVLAWLLSGERPAFPRWIEPLADGATFAVALAAYAVTAARDVLPADAGEFQMVAALLGVAHPFGFPLYTMVGHLFIRLFPWGTQAYRLNLMSGLLAAGALMLVARATRLWARRLGARPLVVVAGGLAAALALGTATTFWAQATIANVRTPAVFLAALALYFLARFATAINQQEADRALLWLALALGLGGGHYPPLAFVGVFFAAYALLTDPRLLIQPRRWWRPVLAGLVSFLLPLAYLPIRGAMGAPQAPEDLDTLSGFLHHFLARGFGGDMFAFANATDLPHRLALIPTLFPFQFNIVLLVAALLGLLGLLRRDWRLFVLLAGSLTLHTFVSVTYRAPQTVEYLMPAYLPIAIAVGLLPSLLPYPHTSKLLCALVLWAGLLNGWAHGPSFIELAGDRVARETVEPLLETAPAGARILADWRWVTPLRYLQWVEGLRPDVEVVEVYPVAEEEYHETWLRRIQETDPQQPLLLTHFYEFADYTTEPWEAGFLIRPRPVAEPATPLTPVGVIFGDQVRLVGYSLRQDQFHPGQVAEFVLAWQPTGPLDPPPSFTLRLVDEEGHRLSQFDRTLSTDVATGEVRFERLALPVYPGLLPDRYQVILGAYAVTDVGFETLPADDGAEAITLTDLELVPLGCDPQSAICDLQSPPFTLHRQAVPLSDGTTLVGVDYDRGVPDVLQIYLHWQGPIDEGYQARVRVADGVEAAASLPPIPAGAYQTVVVYLQGYGDSPLWLSLADEQGQAKTAAGPWGWPLGEVRLSSPAPDARFVPLGDELALIGVTARSANPGETMVVDLTLVALRPLTSDDSTSVRLTGTDGRWLAAHDCQPALGAIPTLKWIRGSRVADRHLLPIPEDFSGEDVQATLVAYERFRMAQLVSMDPRFGIVPLGTWAQP